MVIIMYNFSHFLRKNCNYMGSKKTIVIIPKKLVITYPNKT